MMARKTKREIGHPDDLIPGRQYRVVVGEVTYHGTFGAMATWHAGGNKRWLCCSLDSASGHSQYFIWSSVTWIEA